MKSDLGRSQIPKEALNTSPSLSSCVHLSPSESTTLVTKYRVKCENPIKISTLWPVVTFKFALEETKLSYHPDLQGFTPTKPVFFREYVLFSLWVTTLRSFEVHPQSVPSQYSSLPHQLSGCTGPRSPARLKHHSVPEKPMHRPNQFVCCHR